MAEQLGPCVQRVWNSVSRNHYDCARPGKVEHQGRCYCGIHNPIKKAEKQAAEKAKWERQFGLQRANTDIRKQRTVAIEAARSASHQQASWDAVAEAITELERLESVLKELTP